MPLQMFTAGVCFLGDQSVQLMALLAAQGALRGPSQTPPPMVPTPPVPSHTPPMPSGTPGPPPPPLSAQVLRAPSAYVLPCSEALHDITACLDWDRDFGLVPASVVLTSEVLQAVEDWRVLTPDEVHGCV
jgi:hypothetical protein